MKRRRRERKKAENRKQPQQNIENWVQSDSTKSNFPSDFSVLHMIVHIASVRTNSIFTVKLRSLSASELINWKCHRNLTLISRGQQTIKTQLSFLFRSIWKIIEKNGKVFLKWKKFSSPPAPGVCQLCIIKSHIEYNSIKLNRRFEVPLCWSFMFVQCWNTELINSTKRV